jgi:hypothetical protein
MSGMIAHAVMEEIPLSRERGTSRRGRTVVDDVTGY